MGRTGMMRVGSGRHVMGGVAPMLVAVAGVAALAACAVPPGAGRATTASELATSGPTDAGDVCAPQVILFVNAADLPATPRRTANPRPADLAAEIAAENAAIDRLRVAFDGLRYCRWTEVRVIRADAVARGPAPQVRDRLIQANARFRRDIARAAEAGTRIAERSARLEAAAEAAAPGTRAAAARGGLGRGARAVATAPVPLRQQPGPSAPEIGRLRAGQEATLTPAADGFVLAVAGSLTGYARGDAFAPGTEPPSTDLRTLVASNIAKREAFAEALALAERSAASNFEASL